jgi:hypothetical protein
MCCGRGTSHCSAGAAGSVQHHFRAVDDLKQNAKIGLVGDLPNGYSICCPTDPALHTAISCAATYFSQNFKIGMVGDLLNGRTVHSLAYVLSMFKGVKMYFVAPKVSVKFTV